MPCPVTMGFLYSLEHNESDKTRNTSFEFLADSQGSFPTLRMGASLEEEKPRGIYARRAQYAIQITVSAMAIRSSAVGASIATCDSPREMLTQVEILKEEIGSLVFVSKLKRRKDGDNTHKLADRLIVKGAVDGLEKQLKAFLENDFRAVGYGLGDSFRGLHMPASQALVIGRRLLSIRD